MNKNQIFLALKSLNVLYAEDDKTIRDITSSVLEAFFNRVYKLDSGKDIIKKFKEERVHVVILDIELPSIDGLSAAKLIREIDKDIPIFMTTSHTDKEYLLDAIKLNLVDYLIKPISYDKLKQTLLLCTDRLIDKNMLTIKLSEEVCYNSVAKSIQKGEEKIFLLPKEIDFLEALIDKKGAVLHWEEIEEVAYKGEDISYNGLKNFIHRLKKKIGGDFIKSSKGNGFYLEI